MVVLPPTRLGSTQMEVVEELGRERGGFLHVKRGQVLENILECANGTRVNFIRIAHMRFV